MSIIIGADIVPCKTNYELFEKAQAVDLLGNKLYDLIKKADYRIFNLETPLTDFRDPIEKNGPLLMASTACICGMKAIGTDLLSLANNHIMDQNVQGLESTIKTLDKAAVAHVGAGKDISEAQKPYYFTIKEKTYGVYSCAEHEFSIARDNYPGANPFDPLESPDHVSNMKEKCDYAIVLYHGGKEHYRYPSPNLQRTCRKLVEKGADLVVCQHSHCIGCKEEYLNGTIIYGQGNFLFSAEENECWETGLLTLLNDSCEVSFIPFIRYGNGIQLAENDTAREILDAFEQRSEEIKNPGCVNDYYHSFAQMNVADYAMLLSGKRRNILFRVINKISGHRIQEIYARHYRKHFGVETRNYIECESHRELLLKGLETDYKR